MQHKFNDFESIPNGRHPYAQRKILIGAHQKNGQDNFHNKMQNKGVQHRLCRQERLPPHIRGERR